MNRTLMDKVRIKFVKTGLLKYLWGEAIKSSAYELNRVLTNANLGEVPANRWFGKNDLSRLRVFGCKAWASVIPKQNKLDPRAKKYIMVGYATNEYRLWNLIENIITISRDVLFNERDLEYEEEKKNTYSRIEKKRKRFTRGQKEI